MLAVVSTLSRAQDLPPSWEPGTWSVVLDDGLSNPLGRRIDGAAVVGV